MTKVFSGIRMWSAVAATLLLCSLPLAGETAFTPVKPFRFVVPFEAGGNSDIPARIFARAMNKFSPTEVKVVNLPGAGGRTGAKDVMRSKPDGYTFLQQPVGYPMQYALGVADFTYRDFEPIGYWLDSKLAVVVKADSPYGTLDDLVKAAREKPDSVRVGTVGGTLPLFAVLKIERDNDIAFKKVDLAHSAKVPELLGGRIDCYVDGFGAVKQFIDSNDFRYLAVVSDTKVVGYDAISTFAELGYENYDYLEQRFGLWAPKGTAPEAIAYINELVRQAASDPDCIAELENLSYMPLYTTTAEYVATMEKVYKDFEQAAAGLVKRK